MYSWLLSIIVKFWRIIASCLKLLYCNCISMSKPTRKWWEEQTDWLIIETHNGFEQLWVYKQSCPSVKNTINLCRWKLLGGPWISRAIVLKESGFLFSDSCQTLPPEEGGGPSTFYHTRLQGIWSLLINCRGWMNCNPVRRQYTRGLVGLSEANWIKHRTNDHFPGICLAKLLAEPNSWWTDVYCSVVFTSFQIHRILGRTELVFFLYGAWD